MATRRADKPGSEMIGLVERNIQALLKQRELDDEQLTWQDRLADRIGRFTGSMNFVWLHLIFIGLWVAINLGAVPWVARFDETFVLLATAASVEAIFLSTFVLITQNRMQIQADKRADLNLQVSLLSEHEVTQLIKIVTEIGERLNLASAQRPEINELKQDVRPEEVLETLDRRTQNARGD